MKTKKILALCVISSLLILPVNAKPKAKRVVMIALDGISVEGFQKAHTPNLDILMSEGVISLNTRVVMPSVTLPNWTSHLTGSGPEQHGVVNNDWVLNKHTLPAVDTDEKGYYPSVFKVIKESVPNAKIAFYYNWINLFYPYNKTYFDEVSYLEHDQYKPNFKKALSFIAHHKKAPTVVFLYSVHTDHAGHKHGWMSTEYIRSIEEADIQIGNFIEQLKKEQLYEETHFLFLSDHGGVKYGHGGVTTNEMIVPWGITGPGIKKNHSMQAPNNTVNTASLILRLFKVKQPLSWTGTTPESVFK